MEIFTFSLSNSIAVVLTPTVHLKTAGSLYDTLTLEAFNDKMYSSVNKGGVNMNMFYFPLKSDQWIPYEICYCTKGVRLKTSQI